MSNYRRPYINGGTYFITQVTYQRHPWLCSEIGRVALREAFQHVRKQHPFEIDAIVLLHDHFHTIWTLPENDSDFSLRMRLIKRFVTKYYGEKLIYPGAPEKFNEQRDEFEMKAFRTAQQKDRKSVV